MVSSLQEALWLGIMVFAALVPLVGVILLNALFGSKIKELFTDTKFFIFFFLILSYTLYALGELTWYLTYKVFGLLAERGMQDFYWISGMGIMFVAFLALNRNLYKEHGQYHKLLPQLIGGLAVLVLVGIYFYLVWSETWDFFVFFYTVGGALLVVTSSVLLVFWKELSVMENSLIYLFYSNVSFLLAELVYDYVVPLGSEGPLYTVFQVLYSGAYIFSALAFLTLLMKFYRHSSGKAV